jgi:hypothetical protein
LSERIGGWTSRASGWAFQTTHALPDLADQAPGSDVMQDSDFPWEIAERFFDSQKSTLSARQARYESIDFPFNDDQLQPLKRYATP